MGGAKSGDDSKGSIVKEGGNMGGVRSVGGGGAIFTATVMVDAISVGGGEAVSTDTAKYEGRAGVGG